MGKRRTTNTPARRSQRKRRQASTPLAQQQPYDNLMKSLFEGNEQEAINAFLPGAKYLETLNIEVLRTPMRVDCAYKVFYQGIEHLLHVEFESGSNSRMAARLHNYHASLHYKYDLPVISVIIYLFPAPMAESPYREMSVGLAIVTFHFRSIALWKEEASTYMQQHLVNLYPLLPAMANVDKVLLSQALEEMVQYYKDDETKLGEQLRWLGVLLRRADTVSLNDKEAVQEEMNVLDKLLEEDPYLQQKIATGVAKGIAKREAEIEALKREIEAWAARVQAEAEAKAAKAQAEAEAKAAKAQAEAEAKAAKAQAEAEAKAVKAQAEAEAKAQAAEAEVASLQKAAINIIRVRFPQAAHLAQQKIPYVNKVDALDLLIEQLVKAPSEETTLWLLNAILE